MARQVHAGLFWIRECGPHRASFCADRNTYPEDWYEQGRDVHIPQSAYLLKGEKSLLFDTLSPAAGDPGSSLRPQVPHRRGARGGGTGFVAPSHGSPIPAGELPGCLDRFFQAVHRIADEYRPG